MDLMKLSDQLLEEGASIEKPYGTLARLSLHAWLPNGRGVMLRWTEGPFGMTELRTLRRAIPSRPTAWPPGVTPWRIDVETGIDGGVLASADPDRIRSALRELAAMPVVTLADQAYDYGHAEGERFTRYQSSADDESAALARQNWTPPGITAALAADYARGWADGSTAERARQAAAGTTVPLLVCTDSDY